MWNVGLLGFFWLVIFFPVCGDMLKIDFKSLEVLFYHLWNSCRCSSNELFLPKLIFRLKSLKSHLRNSENQELSSKLIFSCAPLSVILWLSVVFDFGNTVFKITFSWKKEGIVWGSLFYFKNIYWCPELWCLKWPGLHEACPSILVMAGGMESLVAIEQGLFLLVQVYR